MQASNWLVGLLMLTVMAVKLLWGMDLVIVAHLTPRERWRDVLRNGTLYLGWYFVVSGLFLYGALGFLLLRNPNDTVPTWFAIPSVVFTLDCVLAWHFLGPDGSDAEGGK